MKKILFAAGVLALSFTACKKDKDSVVDPPPPVEPSAKLLKKITKTEGGQVTVYNLTYDASKRLTSIKSTSGNEYIDFTYDGNGNVVRMEQFEGNEFKNVYTYSYNNGVPVSGTFKSWQLTAGEPDDLIEDDILTYTVANNQVTKIKLDMTQVNESVTFDLSYQGSNLTKVESNGFLDYKATFGYGDKKSYMPKVFKYVMDHAGLSVSFYSTNDLKSMNFDFPGTQLDNSINTTYTYDAAGYPLTSSDGTSTNKFEYQ